MTGLINIISTSCKPDVAIRLNFVMAIDLQLLMLLDGSEASTITKFINRRVPGQGHGEEERIRML
jgi:hypothetical protein